MPSRGSAISAGALDTLIRIERPEMAAANYGRQVVSHWVPVVEAWAHRRDTTGRELITAGAERAEIEVRYIIRDPHVSLAPSMRVVDGEQLFAIVAIRRLVERGAGFELMCKNADPAGVQP